MSGTENTCHVLSDSESTTTFDALIGIPSDSTSDDIRLFTSDELNNMDFLNIMNTDLIDEEEDKGIEAENLDSLLEQFEATESSDSSSFDLKMETSFSLQSEATKENIKNDTQKKPVNSKVLEKIRASQANKRKTAIMLPLETSSKNNNIHPPSSGSTKLSRILQLKTTSNHEPYTQSLQGVQADHDYCFTKKVSVKSTSEMSLQSTDDIVIVTDSQSISDIPDISNSQDSKDSGVEEGEIIESDVADDSTSNSDSLVCKARNTVFFPCPQTLKSKRNYRKREEPMIPDSSKFYDKIPAYFTTLSLPQKPPKKESNPSNNGINVEDFIPRDRSPTRESDSMYSKIPDYYTCFSNSTKYDLQEVEIKLEPTDEFDNESREVNCSRPSSRRSRSSSCSSSSSDSSCSGSSTSSRERSRDRFGRSKRRRKHSCSSSSKSSCRSRSRSVCSCRSSGSISPKPTRKSRNTGRSSRGYRRSRTRSRSSRSYRSRSRHRSSTRRRSYSRSSSRDRSLERRKLERKKRKEEEKQRQIAERRIVYVGRIPDSYTKKDLIKRFSRFGEIVNVSTHFREYGDNYGFVTFAYTCDAFAAKEKGNSIPGELKFDLCFGGRRQFCDTEYADLDGNTEEQEDLQCYQPSNSATSDFDELLRQARKKIKK